MKIKGIFRCFSSILLGKIICSFFSARHTRNFPARKIKFVWFPSQQAEKRQFSTLYVKMGGGGGGGKQLTFQSFPTKPRLQMLENIINTKTNPPAVTNFPASSSEHPLFCQPGRFLWGTDKVRNRFVGCPCIYEYLYDKDGSNQTVVNDIPSVVAISIMARFIMPNWFSW